MRLHVFLKFVEIRTKLASVIPFLLGTLYSLYSYGTLKPQNVLLMFISLLCFDMATTAINNYLDFKKAAAKTGYNYHVHNAVVRYGIKEPTALITIIALLTTAVGFGLALVVKTNVIVLLIGIISFAAGILYTAGPVPISRMPLGEIFSGFFMGFVIIFLAVYVNVFDSRILSLALVGSVATLSISMADLCALLLFSAPVVTGIGNIMLANNICDLEEDILNKRYTLPHYLGKAKALQLFKALYYIGYLAVIAGVALQVTPWPLLLALLTKPQVDKNILHFVNNPSKKETFVLAVKTFLLINGIIVLLLGASVLTKYAR